MTEEIEIEEIEVECCVCGWLFWTNLEQKPPYTCPICTDKRETLRVDPLEDEG